MEYSELPLNFKKLAVLRNLKHRFGTKPKDIKESEDFLLSDKFRFIDAFEWIDTPEGHNFWDIVEKAESNTELPFLNRKIYEEISSITLKEEKKTPNFSVGDVVVIEKAGSGFGPECKQKVTQITEINLDYLPHGPQKPGCRVSDRYGNAVLKEPDDIVALESFRHATASEASKYLVSKAKEKFPVGSFVSNNNIKTMTTSESFEIDSTYFVKHPDEGNNCVYYIPSRGGNYLIFDGRNWANCQELHFFTSSMKYPKDLSERKVASEWYHRQIGLHKEMMMHDQKSFREHISGTNPYRYKKEDPNVQPIVEAKVKTKKKNKRLIYKHY